MSTTADTARKDVQTILEVTPDGNFGPKTLAAYNASDWPPVAQSPVPAPASPTAPVVSTGGASPFVFADSVEPWSWHWEDQFAALTGEKSPAVGRYFGRTNPATYQYKPAQENQAVIQTNNRVLVILEQTPDVASANGASDGIANAQNIMACFPGLTGEYFAVLDVEGQPSLSSAYWYDWSNAIYGTGIAKSSGALKLLPCLYASSGDGKTWAALKTAISNGAMCDGVWIAAYPQVHANPRPYLPKWDPNHAKMQMPDGSTPPNVQILAWQYLGIEGGQEDDAKFEALDCSLLNPGMDPQWFLARCILPTA